MTEFIMEGGYSMYVLLVVAVVAIVLALRAGLRVSRLSGPDPRVESGVDAVLFWGAYAVVLGVLGTVVGIYQAAGAIEQAREIAPGVIWGGIGVALTTTIFGLVLFALSLLVWYALRTAYRRRSRAT